MPTIRRASDSVLSVVIALRTSTSKFCGLQRYRKTNRPVAPVHADEQHPLWFGLLRRLTQELPELVIGRADSSAKESTSFGNELDLAALDTSLVQVIDV